MRDWFGLDPSVVHLNHGSFGAVPTAVATAQLRIRKRAEANPMHFHRVELLELKAQARAVAGEFLGVGRDEVVLVRNATQAAATALASVASGGGLTTGEAVIVAQHTYETVRNIATDVCRSTGASLEVAEVPIDGDEDAIVRAYADALKRARGRGERPALVVVDHIVSPTAAVMPVRRICEAARAAGALSFVDAAHVPGHVPARPAACGADFWAGTWHKWGFAPRGTCALWVSPGVRERVRPLSGAPPEQVFPLAFDRTGTDDYTGWCCLTDAIAFWRDAGGPDLARRGRTLLGAGAAVVREALPASHAPIPAESAPCMRLVALPAGVASTAANATDLYGRLSARGFETQVLAFEGRGYLRLSAAPYNQLDDYERLAKVLPEAIG